MTFRMTAVALRFFKMRLPGPKSPGITTACTVANVLHHLCKYSLINYY